MTPPPTCTRLSSPLGMLPSRWWRVKLVVHPQMGLDIATHIILHVDVQGHEAARDEILPALSKHKTRPVGPLVHRSGHAQPAADDSGRRCTEAHVYPVPGIIRKPVGSSPADIVGERHQRG